MRSPLRGELLGGGGKNDGAAASERASIAGVLGRSELPKLTPVVSPDRAVADTVPRRLLKRKRVQLFDEHRYQALEELGSFRAVRKATVICSFNESPEEKVKLLWRLAEFAAAEAKLPDGLTLTEGRTVF